MQKAREQVLMRSIVDGQITRERVETRMVYTLADGRKQINDWRGGKSDLTVENGQLVKEWIIRSVRMIRGDDFIRQLAERNNHGETTTT